MFVYGPADASHPKTPSSLALFKSRLVLPFWYWLTQVVLEKRPLSGCNCNSSSTAALPNFITQLLFHGHLIYLSLY